MTDYVVTFTASEQAELLELPPDESPLAPDEIAGRTLVSLISPGTEIGGNYIDAWYPMQPGYAAVFEVSEVGSEIEDIAPGQRCLCTGPKGIGGHRSRQRAPRQAVLPVPERLDPAAAAHARLMGVTWSTLTTTVARPPDRVLVTGLGIVGHLGAQIFRAAGYRVMAIDPLESRRRLAEAKGIPTVLPAVPHDDKVAVADIGLALECSGHEGAVQDAVKAIRKRGEVVLVGVPRARKTDIYAFDVLQPLFRRYATLRSGWEWEISRYGEDFRVGSVFGNLAGALAWLAEGRVDVSGLYATMKPSECQAAYQMLTQREGEALTVAFDWSDV